MKIASDKENKAFTLVEIMVAFFIVMLIYASFSRVFRSSSYQIEKGFKMLELQTLLDSVEHHLREDVRCLKKVELSTEGNPNLFSFQMYSDDEVVRIEYEFVAAKKSILRKQLSGSTSEINEIGAGNIEDCIFSAKIEEGQFQRLDMALKIKVESNIETAARSLTAVAHFTSRCAEPYRPWLAAP
ncbi:MAG: prepilin-type N-terminal cleavage/methylation domain-containing protein [Candidatus Riflebacteria bacterium]|nr:prepilin-type N-terminal cleavage/methylation domain-containing protein [Candidatus Riflebacteria bacterium]